MLSQDKNHWKRVREFCGILTNPHPQPLSTWSWSWRCQLVFLVWTDNSWGSRTDLVTRESYLSIFKWLGLPPYATGSFLLFCLIWNSTRSEKLCSPHKQWKSNEKDAAAVWGKKNANNKHTKLWEKKPENECFEGIGVFKSCCVCGEIRVTWILRSVNMFTEDLRRQ